MLERFESGDDSCLECMEAGVLIDESGAGERFVRKGSAALNARLERLSTGLQVRLNRTRNSFDLRSALAWAQAQLGQLSRFARLKVFDSAVREYLQEACHDWVLQTNSALNSSSSQDQFGSSAIFNLGRRDWLQWSPTAAATLAPRITDVTTGGTGAPASPRRRPIIQ